MIKAKATTEKKVSKEYTAFLAQLKNLKGSYVSIGLHEDAGSYDDGTSVVEVGLWNEFGTADIPSRSWLRSALTKHDGLINSWRQQLLKEITAGKTTVPKALEILGFRIRELVRNQIKSNVPPPNAPSTIDHKKKEGLAPITLVETGLLSRSVEYKVVVK